RGGGGHPPVPPRGEGSGLGGAAAGGLDLRPGRGAEPGGGDVDLHVDLTLPQHLDRLVLADRTAGHEVLDGHGPTLGEQGRDVGDVDDLEGRLERVLEPAQLRQPHVHGGLATLEGLGHLVAGLGALGATTGALALGRLATTHAGAGGAGPRGGAQVVDLQRGATLGGLRAVSHGQSTSSTVTRWATVRTIPRNSGRSSLMTVSPMRFRPRLRTVSRCMCLVPTVDLVWVTFRRAITHLPSARHARR